MIQQSQYSAKLIPETDRAVSYFDLMSCDREQVQYAGAVMPHGAVLILSPNDFSILGASSNAAAYLGIENTELLQYRLDQIFNMANDATIESRLQLIDENSAPQHLGGLCSGINGKYFDVVAHRSGDFFIVEMEALPNEALTGLRTHLFSEVQNSIAALRLAETWQDGMSIAVDELKRLTGFDSVLCVRILDDGSMHTIAEARNETLPSFLDKRFPRSDIPEPGRRQMRLMPIQYAPDLEYEPVPIVMARREASSGEIDLGRAMLRSISRLCNRFYLNIGVHARIVLSLLDKDKQWGFFVCWNSSPRHIGYAQRLACQSFSEVAGLLLNEKGKTVLQTEKLKISEKLAEISASLSADRQYPDLIHSLPSRLRDLIDVSGSALCYAGEIICEGSCPVTTSIQDMLPWLELQDDVFFSDQLPTLFPLSSLDQGLATGLLAIRLLEPGQYLLGFRKEWVHEVTWAGNPQKPVEIDEISGAKRLTPRGSFEAWIETVRGRARPWRSIECETLLSLRNSIVMAQAKWLAEAAKESEQEAQKLLSRHKSEFLANMSHEIRTPLNGVLGMAQIGYRESFGRGRQQEIFSKILGSGRLLLGVINDILDFSKIEAGKLSIESIPLDPNKIVDESIDILSGRAAEKGIALVAEKAPDLPSAILGDPVRLTQVLLNLLSNAVKFTTDGEVRLRARTLEERLIFTVSDTGIGMTDDQLARLFKPFEQAESSTTRKYGGTGLGLSITGQLIDLMQGEIRVSSKPGIGSTFELSLPLTLTEQPVESSISVFRESVGGRRLSQVKILAAEDNELNQMVLWDLLVREGAQLKLVNNGSLAVEAIKSAETPFDIVLMDVQMPTMDGYEAAQRIRELAPALKIIGQTAYALADEREKCRAAGMHDVITKPIDIDLLVAAILHQLESPPENTVIVAAPLVEEPYGSTLIIDWLQLEQRYGSRPSFLERILRTFLTSNADTPHRIRLACKTDDVAELHKLAHGLAGSASFLLAGNVVRHAKAILAVTDSTESTLAEHGGELANALEAMLQEISNRNLS